MKLLARKDVDIKETWDLSPLFASEAKFEEALNTMQEKVEQFIAQVDFEQSDKILATLEQYDHLLMEMNKIATYASLHYTTDLTNPLNNQRVGKVNRVMATIKKLLAFFEYDLADVKQDVLETILASERFNKYMQRILAKKDHRLSLEVQQALATLSPVLDAMMPLYNKLKLADAQFEAFEANGKEYPLSFVLYENQYDYEIDHTVRKNAFKAFSKGLKGVEHSMAYNYQTLLNKEMALAKLHHYDSVYDYLLSTQEVDKSFMDRQIDLIMEHLAQPMRKYARLLQRIHKLDKLSFEDLKLPVDHAFEPTITIAESKKYVIDGLKVMGQDYVEMIDRAFEERWIDFANNIGKTSGAFCSSPYGSHPFILISWSSRMREVFVLAHELGHAGHFYTAHQHNSLLHSRPSLYFIEAPSTFNELLLGNHLLNNTDDLRMKRWILSCLISRTYYHNFVTHLHEAHLQRQIYDSQMQGKTLSADDLKTMYRHTLQQFWGDTIEISEEATMTWMRQQHYYKGFYPYTYSAGLTIGTAVLLRYLKEGSIALTDWYNVLKQGGRLTPVELARLAKVDITTEKPLLDTIQYISDMIDEIIDLTNALEK